jgi:glycerol-3-phosphate acyltransferase PlsY
MIRLVVDTLLAYLLGGIMGGDVVGRLAGGVNLRNAGSGNVGATNALRTRGTRFALAVLAIDIGKGVAAALLLPRLPLPFLPSDDVFLHWSGYACGIGAALGHCYPLYTRFKGGKGVATLTGVFGALLPAALPWMIAAFALVVMLTGYVSLASLTGASVALLWVACFGSQGLWSAAGMFALAMTALLTFKHRENIGRLLAGTESRFDKARVLGRRIERLLGRESH